MKNFINFIMSTCHRYPKDYHLIMAIYAAVSVIFAVTNGHTPMQILGMFALEMFVSMMIGLAGLFSFYVVMASRHQDNH